MAGNGSQSGDSLPSAKEDEKYVTISALDGGHLTLPEYLFITDADPERRATVPSLCFLIQHPSLGNNGRDTMNLIFDLGLKRDLTQYTPAMASHIANRQPVITEPDCAGSLQAGGLEPDVDIDIVILSHVHWDHVGTPSDYKTAKFFVGSGTLHVLQNGAGSHYPAEIFNKDLLPTVATFEFPPTSSGDQSIASGRRTGHTWQSFAGFPNALDLFGDGSVWVIDAPGHIIGHVNLLARIGKDRWVYLGGDCCHDVRILKGEKGIATYDDGHGGQRTVHMDTQAATKTLDQIKSFLGKNAQVQVIVAHDIGWREKNKDKFFPGTI
ncbi:hypothetical protein NA57DRAFT_70450 [Rhizodiscina lignyota]|uniref:Metallo-beta-lactamase domain-containing protein n=1 Tax=Rhizodiscina lignyota TaxID=1504668 RepID=A0A9P4IN88_9PEZI|nr:hypothetical protein NA57DRAFT_70450 [Rhizodiscina lignyota]